MGHSAYRRGGIVLSSGSTLASRAAVRLGDNDSGQVGIGSLGGGSATGIALPTSVQAPAGTSFASVAAGGAFTVGLTTTGRVYSWGSGSVGQLGNGTRTGTTTPGPVSLRPG